LIRRLLTEGYEVITLSPRDSASPKLEKLGCRVIDITFSSQGRNIFLEAVLLVKYLIFLFRYKPDAYFGFTIKSVVYGGIAARLARVMTIMTITGLGTVFIRENKTTKLAEVLYRLSIRKANIVFFQNSDDLSMFVDRGLVTESNSYRVPGSGVDLKRFYTRPMNIDRELGTVSFLMVSRLIRDKGVLEYVKAAEKIRERFPRTRFVLAGPAEVDNPTAIPKHQVERWEANDTIEYVGYVDDVRPLIEEADCVVLPSYREGLPRSLLEASAMCRPIIAAATTGCREVVEEGVTGLMCRPGDADDLAGKIEKFIRLPGNIRREMGLRGRKKMEQEYDEEIVIGKYVYALNSLLFGAA